MNIQEQDQRVERLLSDLRSQGTLSIASKLREEFQAFACKIALNNCLDQNTAKQTIPYVWEDLGEWLATTRCDTIAAPDVREYIKSRAAWWGQELSRDDRKAARRKRKWGLYSLDVARELGREAAVSDTRPSGAQDDELKAVVFTIISKKFHSRVDLWLAHVKYNIPIDVLETECDLETKTIFNQIQWIQQKIKTAPTSKQKIIKAILKDHADESREARQLSMPGKYDDDQTSSTPKEKDPQQYE